MEKNIAIMMADLSGYSALTETHGAVSAANLIDRYISIAENCLVGDCKLHQQTGDEIMFVSDSPDTMLATAIKLAAITANEENFLQVHGGLHYGNVLKRGSNYFGFAVNLASRIAAKSTAGSFCCSAEFFYSITDQSVCKFQSLGNHFFKNISKEMELFEVGIDKTKAYFIDPVCRMLILDPEKAFRHPNDEQLYFCSSQCLELYKEKNDMVK